MKRITYGQIESLAKTGTLLTGYNISKCHRHNHAPIVGCFAKDGPNSITFKYRIITEREKNLIRGHLFFENFHYVPIRPESQMTSWKLEPLQAKTLIDAWNAAEDRYNNRQKFVGNIKAPFENVISEVKENIVSLVPEIPLDRQDKFLTQTKIIMSKCCIRFTYNVHTGAVQWIDLDSLVSVENFVKKVAEENKLTFRASRLSINSMGLLHEFFFN